MDTTSNWTGTVTAKSSIDGANTLSLTFNGSFGFAILLSQQESPEGSGVPAVPVNSTVGRMAGVIDTQISTPKHKVNGNGSGEWTVAGTYDPATESVRIAVRSSGMSVKGFDIALGESSGEKATAPTPFASNWKWGWPAPKMEEPATILDVLKPPVTPVIPSERDADNYMMNSLPQTGQNEFQYLTLDLKNPKPQSVTQTFQDESGWGTRTTTWEFMLTPIFEIERIDRPADGRNSMISTDTVSLRMGIPGVTVARSGWSNLATWDVKGVGPFSGSGTPSQLPRSPVFSFRAIPGARPTPGSMVRNRPLQYTVTATFEGAVQYFLLTQDDIDLLRQEYVDHGEATTPPRSDCVTHPIDNAFNLGNYNVMVDGGMEAALGKVTTEFAKDSKGTIRVVNGFRCPQRNIAMGDAHPNNPHVYGRALDLVPEPTDKSSLTALHLACLRAGYRSVLEASPGKEVPLMSPEAKHVHIDW
ncbi:MAG: hypothetical protein ABSG45_01740 [Nitrososphaerales archaeon]